MRKFIIVGVVALSFIDGTVYGRAGGFGGHTSGGHTTSHTSVSHVTVNVSPKPSPVKFSSRPTSGKEVFRTPVMFPNSTNRFQTDYRFEWDLIKESIINILHVNRTVADTTKKVEKKRTSTW